MSERMVPLDLLTLVFCLAHSIYEGPPKILAFLMLAMGGEMGAVTPNKGFTPVSLMHAPDLLKKSCRIKSLYQTLCSAMQGDEDDRGSGRLLATG